ncbi:MAG: hypothetical protein GX335_01085 [Firmicutes bacterium]|nr:hypothetical protein [Bacillota bacterium]
MHLEKISTAEMIASMFNTDVSLKKTLNMQTKDDLLSTCRRLGIKKVSRLNKPELVEQMTRLLPKAVFQKMHYWDQPVFDLIQQIAANDSFYTLDSRLHDDAAEYLLDEGIGFTKTLYEVDYLFLPSEIKDLFLSLAQEDFQKIINRNTEVARLAKGLLYYYGVLTAEELADFINGYLDRPLSEKLITAIVAEIGFYTWDIFFESGLFSDLRLVDLEYIWEERQRISELNYRSFTKSQIWRAGEPGFKEQIPEGLALQKFLANQGFQEEDTADVTVVLFELVQNGVDPLSIAAAAAEYLRIESEPILETLTKLVVNYYLATPSWVFKGYSPDDFFQGRALLKQPRPLVDNVYDFTTKKKIGRNAPCPCGSGLKFQHCCGKL